MSVMAVQYESNCNDIYSAMVMALPGTLPWQWCNSAVAKENFTSTGNAGSMALSGDGVDCFISRNQMQ